MPTNPSLVTIELSTIVVRLHNEPTVWGAFAGYESGFLLLQVAPHIFEAKLAKNLKMKPSHQRALVQKLIPLGVKKVFMWRHKPGKPPYKLVITEDKIYRENA